MTDNPYWREWRDFVRSVLEQGRTMTPEEREKAEGLVREAKAWDRREKRKAKRLARGGEWVEKGA